MIQERNSVTTKAMKGSRLAPIFLMGLVITMVSIATNRPTEAAGNAEVGAKLFTQDCARCHGSHGKGNGPDLAKIHADPRPDDWTNKETNAELSDYKIRKIVSGGGPAVDKSSKMPAFASKISPPQIDDLIAFIRTLAK
jgi:mono/diheme cytochrome c family protein